MRAASARRRTATTSPAAPGAPRAVTTPQAGPCRGSLSARFRDEAGSSPITTVFGVAVFLGFMLLSTQVLVHLYATSTVTAVAFETARRAAADGADCASIGAATHIRTALGDYGQSIDPPVCREVGDHIEVTISGPTPARMVAAFGSGLGPDRIDRTARVRVEGRSAAGGSP